MLRRWAKAFPATPGQVMAVPFGRSRQRLTVLPSLGVLRYEDIRRLDPPMHDTFPVGGESAAPTSGGNLRATKRRSMVFSAVRGRNRGCRWAEFTTRQGVPVHIQ
jgi:hypothetical protein